MTSSSSPTSRSSTTAERARVATATSTARWLAGGLVALPVLQLAPIEFERSAAALVVLPGLVIGRSLLADAVSALVSHPWRRVWLAVATAALVAIVAFADQPAPAAVQAANWLVWLAAAGLASGAVRAGGDGVRRTLLLGVLGGGALGAGVLAWTWFFGAQDPRKLSGPQVAWFYPHIRHVGLHLVCAWVAGWALLVHAPKRFVGRIVLALAAGLVSSALLWSGGRAPLVGLGLALVAALLTRQGGERRKVGLAWALLLAAGLAGSLACWHPDPQVGWWGAWRRSASAVEGGDATALTSYRNLVWSETWHRALRTPWLGHGPDGYRYLMPKLDGQQPHDIALEALVDGGFPWAALTAAGLLWLGWVAWRRSREGGGLAAAGAWALVAGVATGFFDGVFYHVLAALPLAVAVGVMTEAQEPGAHACRPMSSAMALPLRLVGALAAVVLVVHAVEFHLIVRGAPPASPEAPTARLWRLCPTTTYKLEGWLDAWWPQHPEATLGYASAAAAHSPTPWIFLGWRAQHLAQIGRHAEALQALAEAQATLPRQRPPINASSTPPAEPAQSPPPSR